MKIIITGGSGFVARNLIKFLADKKNIKILAVTRHPDKIELKKNITCANPDNIPKEAIASFYGADSLVALAAQIRIDNGIVNKNLELLNQAIELARKTKTKKIIFLSSADVLNKYISEYGRSKIACEHMLKKSGLPYAILRPTVIYGKDDNFISKISAIIRRTKIIPMIDGGKYLWQPISVIEVVNEIWDALISNQKNIVKTLAGKETFTQKQMFKFVAKSNKTHVLFVYVPSYLIKGILHILSVFSPKMKERLAWILDFAQDKAVNSFRISA